MKSDRKTVHGDAILHMPVCNRPSKPSPSWQVNHERGLVRLNIPSAHRCSYQLFVHVESA